ncbi:MAG: MATE family efflux transporter [Bacillota bacterium]
MKSKSMSKEFTSIWNLSWPVIVGMALQSLLGTVDLKFISMIGTTQTAAASISNSAAGVIFVMCALVASGTVAIVARAYGEENHEEVRRIGGQSVALAGIIGGLIGVLCSIFTVGIVKVMFQPESGVLHSAEEYLSTIFLGTIFVFLSFTIRSILQALGDTKTPLYIFAIANVLNMILDPILIFSFGYGIKGAAIATVFSNIIAFFLITWVLIRKLYHGQLKTFIRYMKIHIYDAYRILRIGGWACLQQISRPITGMLMFNLVNSVGKKEGVAAFGIGGQLFNYTFILLAGLTVAISVMVGQNLGRKDIKQAELVVKEGIKIALLNMAIFAIPYVIFPDLIIRFFSTDPNVVKIGIEYLRIVYIGVFFVILPVVYGGAFQGAGDTFPPMISSLFANVVVKLLLAYWLAKPVGMGTNGVWIAISISVIVEALIIWIVFQKGTWKTKEV